MSASDLKSVSTRKQPVVTGDGSGDAIVAIDGPVGVGKSSVARKLARNLGFQYLDTGAMYRAVIWKAHQQNPDPAHWTEKLLVAISDDFPVSIRDEGKVFFDDQDISEAIRDESVSREVYRAADLEKVRRNLVRRQQEMGKEGPSVLEGRDITTVVFPDARWKFYLDASPKERAMRRWLQLKEKGFNIKIESLMRDLRERDQRDRNRSVGNLKIADDALVIDTTSMTEQMVIDLMAEHVRMSHVINSQIF